MPALLNTGSKATPLSVASGQNFGTVRREQEARDSGHEEAPDLFPARHIPKAHRLVVRPSGNSLAVGREGDVRVGGVLLVAKGLKDFTGRSVAQLRAALGAAEQQSCAIR